MPPSAGRQDRGAFRALPLTPVTWPDLEQLFSLPGGSIVRGCWCMYYRKSGQPAGPAGAQNKQAMCDLVSGGTMPGLVGYLGDTPVGWISLGPREDYLKLRRSPIMKPVDDTRVWSVVCSYVARPYRGMGLQRRLLAAAISFARENGVRVLEAYPVDKAGRSHDDFMFFGSRSLYERAGFTEVVRRSPSRVVMRRKLRPRSGGQLVQGRLDPPLGNGNGRAQHLREEADP
jgi:GNAT superfamily N-acetyltransferase